jgi:hypothetical protein
MQQLITGLLFSFRYHSTRWSGILIPIIRSLSTAATAASGLPQERGGISAVGCGRAGQTDHGLKHCYHHVPTVKQRLLLQVKASDDGHKDARNMLSGI